MSAVSLPFFALLAATVALIATVPGAWRRWVLLIASALFYFGVDPVSAGLGLAVVAVNFAFLRALLAESVELRRDRLYFASIGFNVAAFVVLKLTLEAASEATAWRIAGWPLGYPLGFSFMILMLHAALSDAYTELHTPRGRPGTFALYALFFPYLTSGPVERLGQMEERLDRPRRPALEDLRAGIALIALGLVKKLVVANRIGPYVDAVFAAPQPQSATTLVLAIALNAAHVYCDFSGYTDIARGAARCLGIEVRINFARPFVARSVTEFWRRWHISFSTWLRDYLYMPLAYALRRATPAAPFLAIVPTFLVAGFWHRATWTFCLFGLAHGVAMALEMRFGRPLGRFAPGPRRAAATLAARLYTLVFLGLSIVLFSASSIGEAGAIVVRLAADPLLPWPRELFGYLGPFLFLLMAGAILAWQVLERWHERLTPACTPAFVAVAALLVLFLGLEGPGFIYEQF